MPASGADDTACLLKLSRGRAVSKDFGRNARTQSAADGPLSPLPRPCYHIPCDIIRCILAFRRQPEKSSDPQLSGPGHRGRLRRPGHQRGPKNVPAGAAEAGPEAIVSTRLRGFARGLEAAFVEQAARPPRKPGRTAFDFDQHGISDLLSLDRCGTRRCGDHRLSLNANDRPETVASGTWIRARARMPCTTGR